MRSKGFFAPRLPRPTGGAGKLWDRKGRSVPRSGQVIPVARDQREIRVCRPPKHHQRPAATIARSIAAKMTPANNPTSEGWRSIMGGVL